METTNGHEAQPEEAIRGTESPTEGRCNSLLRHQRNRYCPNYPIHGRNRCKHHGGKTVQGRDHPAFKSGRWSKSLPTNLAAKYDELVGDSEIINLGQDIALLDVRLTELLGRLETEESEFSWRKARQTFTSLRGALTSGDKTQVRDALQQLNQVLNSGAGADQNWREIREALQERRLLVESERRRLVDMHQMVTVEEVLILVTAISAVVNQNVEDPRARQRIASDIQGMLGPGGRVAAAALRGPRTRVIRSTARRVEQGD